MVEGGGGGRPQDETPAVEFSWRRIAEFLRDVIRLEASVAALQRDNERLNAELAALQREVAEQAGQMRVPLRFIDSALDDKVEARAERAAVRAIERIERCRIGPRSRRMMMNRNPGQAYGNLVITPSCEARRRTQRFAARCGLALSMMEIMLAPATSVRNMARLAFAALLVGLSAELAAPHLAAAEPFPSARPDRPGHVLGVEQMKGAPAGATAFKVKYRSTDPEGKPVVVSGVVVVPARPAGRLDIVAWAHPTTGVAPGCSPSLLPGVFNTIPGLADLLARGYAVTATNYPGLGEPGIVHPYLVGESEGRAVLDSVRAAREVIGPDAGERFAVWGHSQGGHAALFAGEIAAGYAPELKLVGVAAAAPATDLRALFRDDVGSASGKVLASFTLWSWARVYGLDLNGIVAPEARGSIDALAEECIEGAEDDLAVGMDALPLRQAFLSRDPTTTPPWPELMERNTPGRRPAGAPVFIAQGTEDAIVRPEVTTEFADRLCRAGASVRLVLMAGVNHAHAGRKGAASAVAWMADRFAGKPAPNGCRRSPSIE